MIKGVRLLQRSHRHAGLYESGYRCLKAFPQTDKIKGIWLTQPPCNPKDRHDWSTYANITSKHSHRQTSQMYLTQTNSFVGVWLATTVVKHSHRQIVFRSLDIIAFKRSHRQTGLKESGWYNLKTFPQRDMFEGLTTYKCSHRHTSQMYLTQTDSFVGVWIPQPPIVPTDGHGWKTYANTTSKRSHRQTF